MKIRGNPVGTTMKRPDFNQTNPKKSDYILNNPIPQVTEKDEGKILQVKDGKWSAEEIATGETATDKEVEKVIDITLKITNPSTVSAKITLFEPLSKDIYIRLYRSYCQTNGEYAESAEEVFIPAGTTVYDYCDYPEGGASDVSLVFFGQDEDSFIEIDDFHIQYKTGETITQNDAVYAVYRYVNAIRNEIDSDIGDIDSALDAIIELQNSYIGVGGA